MFPLIREHVSLSDKNWFQTGGAARFFTEPRTEQEFQDVLAFAHQRTIPLFILGQGANILISDTGFDGLVVRPQINHAAARPYDQDHELLEAGAGWSLHDLIEYCLNHNLSGLEEFSGIPGSIGGAVYINLHYFEYLLEQFLVSARVIHATSGQITDVDRAWFEFGYDQSKLIGKEYLLVSATFKLKKVSPLETAYARGRRAEIIRHRSRRYPLSHTCGSFFRNFHDHEVTLMSNGKKMVFAAYYLDKVSVKGTLRVGNAIVSHQHANMIVNMGKATSQDIIALARRMQETVYEQFGTILQPECQLVGFNEYPLITAMTEHHPNHMHVPVSP